MPAHYIIEGAEKRCFNSTSSIVNRVTMSPGLADDHIDPSASSLVGLRPHHASRWRTDYRVENPIHCLHIFLAEEGRQALGQTLNGTSSCAETKIYEKPKVWVLLERIAGFSKRIEIVVQTVRF